MPIIVMAATGIGRGTIKPSQLLGAMQIARDLTVYLWKGQAASDSIEVRTAHIRKRFTAALDTTTFGVPAGAVAPMIDYIADQLAHTVADGRS